MNDNTNNVDVIRETSFSVNDNNFYHEAPNTYCEVTAVERKYITMIKKLKESHPDEVQIIAENEDGSIFAHVPASWMTLKPKRTVNLTEEQRQVRAERARSLFSTRSNAKNVK